ncbi:MAG: NUDIX domain-containing protein [Actinomycetota bacterium]
MGRPELCVGAVTIADDALLVVRRATEPEAGRWSLPGGRVEAGELVAEAVVREVEEETGIVVVCGELLGWAELPGPDQHFVILDFHATPLEVREPVAGTDAAEARWVPLVDVADLDLVDGLAGFLSQHRVIPALGD